eukprot:scaffold131496_cov45-Phaeocystis_antarctica.AAC.3
MLWARLPPGAALGLGPLEHCSEQAAAAGAPGRVGVRGRGRVGSRVRVRLRLRAKTLLGVRIKVSAAAAAQGGLEVGVERVVVLVEEVRSHVTDVAREVAHLYTYSKIGDSEIVS